MRRDSVSAVSSSAGWRAVFFSAYGSLFSGVFFFVHKASYLILLSMRAEYNRLPMDHKDFSGTASNHEISANY